MMNNKKILIIPMIIVLLAGLAFVFGRTSPQGPHQLVLDETAEGDVEYWTCSMHPQVRKDAPGKCPICGMPLIPVHTGDKGKIVVEEQAREHLDIRSVPAETRHFVKKVRLPGKISHDYEFYRLQQEYLSVLASLNTLKDSLSKEVYERQEVLLESVKFRLKLLGLSDEQIKQLEERNGPDESLISPVKGKAWAQADIYEQDLNLVEPGQEVAVKIGGYEEEFTGRIHSIEDVLNPQTRSATARVEINDSGSHLKHEAFADLTLEVDLGQRLSVPRSSVIDTGTRKIVYVDTGDGRYQMRQVDTGVEAQGFVEVKEGISEGERVVTDGNFLLDSQSTLTGGQSLLYSGSEQVNESPKQQPHRH
jgi:Cu(I)/Ag(I) efflux system membrane fusion protein